MQVKEIIITNDITTSKNLLDTVTAEHDTFANSDIDESMHLHHAKDHLDAFDDSNNIAMEQKEAAINALDET